VTKRDKSISDIKKIISDQKNIIDVVCQRCIIPEKYQNKYPPVLIKQSTHVNDNENRQKQVNQIGEDIVIHIMQTF
jgi:hypothetical protein